MDKGSIEKRLLKKRLVDPETDCWLWTGCTNINRRNPQATVYGRLGVRGTVYKVHRLAAWLYKGFYLDSTLCVCHKCDTPLCFNPEHLFTGTYRDNVRDCIKKGRGNKVKGEAHYYSKITEQQAEEVIRLLGENLSIQEVMKHLKLSRGIVSSIKNKRTWQHLVQEVG